MKLKQISLCAAFAAALVFGAASAFADGSSYPSVKLSVSGTLAYTANDDTDTQGSPIRYVSYNTQTLIYLLNASVAASNQIFAVTGQTHIPTGSFFLWNPDESTLIVTNTNGFSFALEGEGDGFYDFGSLEIDEDQLIGTYTLAPFTLAGSETDRTGIEFYFDDGSSEVNEIELYGTATFTWSYGAASGGNQRATLTVTMTGCGNDDSYVDDYDAIPTSFSASGSGSGSEPSDDIPFYYEW